MPTLNDTQYKTTQTILVRFDTDRFYLSSSRVEIGQFVFATETRTLYVIKDVDELDNTNGYTNLTAGGGGGGGTWGSITGDIDQQTDLWDLLVTYVTLNGSQTLTNKTIEDANLTGTATAENLSAANASLNTVTISRTLVVDNTCAGFSVSGANAGATISQWQTVYNDFTDGEWKLADADSAATAPAAGLAVTAGTDGNPLVVFTRGFVRNDAWNWSAGNIFLSTTAGGLTQTAPNSSTQIVQQVGRAVTADIAYFDFNQPYFEVT